MINYTKYENAEKNVLTNAFISLEKKQKKLLQQIKENDELLKYLSDKITSAFKPQTPIFYTIDTSPTFKKIDEWAEQNPQEAEAAKNQVLKELGLN